MIMLAISMPITSETQSNSVPEIQKTDGACLYVYTRMGYV